MLKKTAGIELVNAGIGQKSEALFEVGNDINIFQINQVNPDAAVFRLSARTGEGLDAFADWLVGRLEAALAQLEAR